MMQYMYIRLCVSEGTNEKPEPNILLICSGVYVVYVAFSVVGPSIWN